MNKIESVIDRPSPETDYMPRTTPEEARELLLAAGVEEFREQFQERKAESLLAGLRLEAIAKRAGYRSPGMVYNLWRSPEGPPRAAYFADLLERIAHSYTSIEVELDVELSDDLVSTTRSMAVETLRYWSGEGAERHIAGRLLTASLHIPAIRTAMRETATATLNDATTLFESVLTELGYRMREPLRPVDMTVALRALLLGYLDLTEIHSAEMPTSTGELFEWRGSPGWNAFSVASLGIVLEMVEEIPD